MTQQLRYIIIIITIVAVQLNPWRMQAEVSTQSNRPHKTVRLRTFSMADGLPTNSISMMSVGHNGLLWISSWNGLCNYDGYRFNTFQNIPGAKDVLHGNRITFAYPSDNGDVWLATFDDHLFRLDARERRFVDCKEMLSGLGIDNFRVDYMQALDDGSIRIQGTDGVNLLAKDGKLKKTDKAFAKTDYSTFIDSKGRIWEMLDDGTITCRPKSAAPGYTRKVYTLNMPANWPVTYTDRPIMLEDEDETVWFMPNKGTVCYFDEVTDSLVPINLREVDHKIPNELYVTFAVTDKQKNLWFRNNTNLCQMLFSSSNFKFTPIVEGAETRSVFVDSSHRLWSGTKPGHLAIIDSGSTTPMFLTAIGTLSSTPVIFDDKGIYAIYEDNRHNMWIGTRGNGLYRLSPSSTGYKVERFMSPSPNGNDIYSHIYDILDDGCGHIWFAGYGGGIIYFDEKLQKFFTGENCRQLELPQSNIRKMRRIEKNDDGTLIFSTTEGIVTLNCRFDRPEDIRLNVSQYSPDEQNSLWAPDVLQTLISKSFGTIFVSTMGGGLQSIRAEDLEQNQLDFAGVDHNFSNIGNIRGMVEDRKHNIWLIGENAMHCLAINENDRHTYTVNDWIGVNSGIWSGNAGFSEARPKFDPESNKILLGTLGGIISFDPEMLSATDDVPSIVFTGIQYQGDEQQTPLSGTAEIIMPSDRHNAVVYFAALDYEDNLQIRYAYRILGLDDKWNYVGLERCASLSNLPPGHYTLEVRSTNNEGVWVDNNTELRIYVEPTFWQTPWAIAIYVLLGALLVFGSVYLLWLRKAHRIEKDMNERQLRFFTDISHRLRTPLTLIDGPVTEILDTEPLSEKAGTLLKAVKSNSSEMLRLVDEALELKKLKAPADQATDGSAECRTEAGDAPATPGEADYAPTDLTILIVEDNADLRYFLKSSLSAHYNIIEAENGKEGLRMAARHQPDFIITDVMMPEMDGITMLRHIKNDPAISHIPIIILSARTADIYRIEGLKEGADDYITKPFSMSYLQVRVESIVRQRRLLQEEWRRSLAPSADVTPAEGIVAAADENETQQRTISAIDSKFVDDVTAFINANLHNPDLKIDEIASAMCMSRTVLYGKIKAIYGMSPNDVLRNLRITRACAILRENPEMNIAEVAMTVGYNDSKYFARYFKQIVGVNPSEYRKG